MPRFFAAASLLALSSGVRAQTLWNGPLPTQNERPYQSAFAHFEPRSPEVLNRGQSRFGAALHVANDLLIPNPTSGGEVREDFETQRLQLDYARGLGRDWELGGRTGLVARDGGALDGFISAYHRLFGILGNGPDNPTGRDAISRGRDVLFFRNVNGTSLNQGGAFGLTDTQLELRRQLSAGVFASSLHLGVKVPTGNGARVLGSGGFDGGVGLDARRAVGSRFAFFGDVGAFVYGRSKLPNAARTGAQAGLGFEWKVGERDSLVAQIDGQSRVVRTGNAFADRVPVGASVGFKRRVSRNKTFFVSFTENGDYVNYHAPWLSNIGPDLTLSAGLEVLR